MISSSHKARQRASGFTLLELLVVLALIAFFAAMAVPIGARTMERAALKRDISVFASTIRRARAEAISSGESVDMVIDVSKGVYKVGPAGSGVLPASAETSLIAARELMDTPDRGVIRFFPDGGTSGARIVVVADGDRHIIVVDWLTGAVSLERERIR